MSEETVPRTRYDDVIAAMVGTALALQAQRDEAIRQRDQLRRILEPLLDTMATVPNRWVDGCHFCDGPFTDGEIHALDCPVLRRDALLGRERAPAPPAGGAA